MSKIKEDLQRHGVSLKENLDLRHCYLHGSTYVYRNDEKGCPKCRDKDKECYDKKQAFREQFKGMEPDKAIDLLIDIVYENQKTLFELKSSLWDLKRYG